nr:MAG TPA: hypothetical protein [Caudoviricetes sp.]
MKLTLIKNQPLKRPLFYILFYTMKGVMSIFSTFRPCPEANKQGEYNEIQ